MTYGVIRVTSIVLAVAVFSGMSDLVARAAEVPAFETRVIDPHVGDVCYAVTLADVNGDSRLDIVAVTENAVVWYAAPEWRKQTIIENATVRDNVCIAPLDIDRDGRIDFALGAGWTKVGTLQWLSRGDSLDEEWHVHMIGEEPWTHRMRFADVLGTGRPQLVVSPLNRTVGDGVRLTAFAIPEQPGSQRWPRTVLDHSLNRMHNHWHIPARGDHPEGTLTASQEGLHRILVQDGGEVVKTKLHSGTQAESAAQSGAGEIKTGALASGRQFITTIEPMHGTSVVVYLMSEEGLQGEVAERHVIEETLGRGHALWPADVDRDGSDELVVGHSDPASGSITGPGVYIYDATDASGTTWAKHVIDDGGIATEDLICADVTGDGLIDIVAGGRATHNIKLYVNQGRP